MRSRAQRLVSVVFLLLLTSPMFPALAADAPPIEISTQPGTPPGPIAVTFEPGSDAATVPVFIGQSGTETLSDVRLYGQLTDQEGRALTTGQVEFLQSDADAPLGKITLEPNSGQTRARLRISQMGELYGQFRGYLAAEIGGTHHIYNELQVERPGAPVLTVREADAQGQIQVVTSQPALNAAIYVSETGGKAGVRDVRLTASPLRTAEGQTIRVTIEPNTFALRPNGSQIVVLRGRVPTVGAYTGLLQVHWGDQQQPYDLKLERKAAPQNVKIEAVAPVPSTRIPGLSTLLGLIPSPVRLPGWFGRWPWLNELASYRASDVRIPLVLRETAGSATATYYPTLDQLSRVGQDATETQASLSGWYLADCAGQQIATQAPAGEPAQLTLASYDSDCLVLFIRGIQSAGNYKAKVALSSPGGIQDSIDVVVQIRDHWILAALVIFLGALASYHLRHWLEIGRERQISRLGTARLGEKIREQIGDAQDRVRVRLLEKLAELDQTAEVDTSIDVPAALEEIRGQLNDYLQVRAVLDLQPDLDKVVPDPAQRAQAQATLDEIDRMLDTADPLSALPKAKERAGELQKQIETWKLERLKDGIDKLDQALQADLKALPSLSVPEEQRAALKTACESLRGKLAAAASRAGTDYEAAQTLYEEAREEYAQVAVERLRLVLESQSRPLGFGQQAWDQAQADLLQQLEAAREQSPGEARQTVEEVRTSYLEQVIEHLSDQAGELRRDLEKKGGTEERQRILAQAVSNLEAALQQVDADPDGAEAAYRQAREDYLGQFPEAERGQLQDATGRPAPGAPAQSPGSGIDPGGAPGRGIEMPEGVGEDLSPAKIIKEIHRKDLQALYITSAVSVLVGLQALWVTNSTFGGLAAYIAAFLWGFGLHELNKVALPAAARRLQLPWYPSTKPAGEE